MDQTALGLLLQHLREKRSLKLRELAQLANVDHAYVYRLETGAKERPSDHVLSRLIRGVNADKREAAILRYAAEHAATAPALAKLAIEDATITFEIFATAAGSLSAARRGRMCESWSTECVESWTRRMTLDEFTVVLRARKFVAKMKPATIPVPMQPYLDEVGTILRRDEDLRPDEPAGP